MGVGGERERMRMNERMNEWMGVYTSYLLDVFSCISIMGVKKWKTKFSLHT